MAKRRELPELFLKSDIRLANPKAVNKKRPVFIKAPWRYTNFNTEPSCISSGESQINRIPKRRDIIMPAGNFCGFTIARAVRKIVYINSPH